MTTESELQKQLREAAVRLDEAAGPVAAAEVLGSRPASGGRQWPVARVLAAATAVAVLALVAVGVLATGDDTPLATADRNADQTVERRDLYGASHSVVDEELWVFGGLSAPPGTAPPVTAPAPPGWTANDVVTVYGPDGAVRRRFELDGLAGRTLSGWVVAVGDDRYLLGNLCSDAAGAGCSGTFEPYLVRFATDQAIPVPLQLPEGDLGDEIGSGLLSLNGQGSDGLLWASQEITESSGLPVYPTRLLAIDAKTGVGVGVNLPDGLVRSGTVCLSESGLFAILATLEEGRLVSLRIMNRPATTEPADWMMVVEPDLALEQVYGGSLECLPRGEVAMLVVASPNGYLATYSVPSGSPVHERYDLPPDGARVVGHVGDLTILASRTRRDAATVITHEPGEGWVATGTELTSDAVPVVLGGDLRDVRAALASLGADDLNFPSID